ncbi:hypothetical protein CVV38_03215 [Candidatus Peregrinibacteria bacterium HGW-Peregrinibacteria-1]|jgi:hypothetical protein|nr:MAG: hypothetical protein CVV38_03215 [Candidatus Peregrinibacteria bacterium HGW-Peregrinibacteria-1]
MLKSATILKQNPLQTILSKILAGIAITLSIPLILIITITGKNSTDFFNNQLPDKIREHVISIGPKYIIESQQFQNFPQFIRDNLSHEEIIDILNAILTQEVFTQISSSTKSQLLELIEGAPSGGNISIPLDFIKQNRQQVSSMITQAILPDLDQCEPDQEYSPTTGCIGNDTTESLIAEGIEIRHINTLPNDIKIDLEIPEAQRLIIKQATSINEKANQQITKLIIGYLLFMIASILIEYTSLKKATRKGLSIISKSAITNAILYGTLFATINMTTSEGAMKEIITAFLNAVLAPIIVTLIIIIVVTTIATIILPKTQITQTLES